MDIRLNGRSAVITGGSKGLGLAIAEEYAKSIPKRSTFIHSAWEGHR